MGFPGRTSFDALGGIRVNRGRITKPDEQNDATKYNELQWQVAGMNAVSALVTLTIAADGTRTSGREAWNMSDDVSKRVAITHPNTGEYVITAQASTYEDWAGIAQNVIFYGAIVSASSTTSVRPPTWALLSPTSIKIYTWNAAGSAADMPFAVDIK